MTRKISRRTLLKAAGGALVALPLAHAFRARAGDGQFPQRLVLVYNPNGSVPDEFWPDATSETDFTLKAILKPLQAFKDRLTLLRGVDLSVTSVGPGGPHQRGVGALYTGRELEEGTFVGGDGSLAGWATGISVDQQLAQGIGPGTALNSLELGVRATEAEVRSRISYAGAAKPLPPQNDPTDVYNRLFADLSGNPDELLVLRAQRKSVLDAVHTQFSALGDRVGAEDAKKLEQHAELVRDVERRLDVTIQPSEGCTKPPAPPALGPDDENDMPDITQLQLDMLAMAFACDITRIASVQFSNAINDIRFPWLDSMDGGHNLSHMGPSNEAARGQLIDRNAWHAEQLAYFMQRLDAIPEGDGSVLDNTLIVWGNEISVGNTHSLDEIPFLLAGSAGGAIKTGRYLQYDHAPHNNLLVAILNAFGVETDTFGNPDFCTGPLTGLLA